MKIKYFSLGLLNINTNEPWMKKSQFFLINCSFIFKIYLPLAHGKILTPLFLDYHRCAKVKITVTLPTCFHNF